MLNHRGVAAAPPDTASKTPSSRYPVFDPSSNTDTQSFSITVRYPVYLPLILKNLWRLTIRLGQESIERGLFLDYGGDVDTEVVSVGSTHGE